MALRQIDYNQEGLLALYALITQDYPLLELTQLNSQILGVGTSPTPAQPGRTFVLIKHNESGVTHRFSYNRTSLSEHFGKQVTIDTPVSPVTQVSLVEELNVSYGTHITPRDALFDGTLHTGNHFTLKAKRESLQWYGKCVITLGGVPDDGTITPITVVDDDGVMIVDDDGVQLTWDESGEDFTLDDD